MCFFASPAFNVFYVVLSLVSVASGAIVVFGLLTSQKLSRYTATFSATTATTVTGVGELRNAHNFALPIVFRDVIIHTKGTIRRDWRGPGKFNSHPRTGCMAMMR